MENDTQTFRVTHAGMKDSAVCDEGMIFNGGLSYLLNIKMGGT